MNQKSMIGVIIALIIVGGVAFYGGMVYAGKKTTSSAPAGTFAGARGARGFTQGQGQGGQGRGGAGGFVSGEVLSKDGNSITLKLQDGGSKIVVYATSTHVGKMTDGSLSDLVPGTQVTVTGAANPDGSVTASTVQIRPVGSTTTFMGGMRLQNSGGQQ